MVLAEGHTGGGVLKAGAVIDLAPLPATGMGTASLPWWGTLAFMLIEGTGLRW